RGLGRLERCVEFPVDGKAAILVARHGGGPSLVELILALNDLALGGGHVGRKGEEEALAQSFLESDAGSGIGIVAAQGGVDREAGESRKFLNSTADPAGRTLSQE